MAEFSTHEVCTATNGVAGEDTGRIFNGVSTDTRTIRSGNLFVALCGERFDGHDFIGEAVANGARGVLVSKKDCQIPAGIQAIYVENTLQAFQDLARYHRLRFKIPVIAVTGSNGKTTTKDMVASVLSARFRVLKTEANFNNEIGLPQTLLRLTPNHDIAVVEVGMRGLGEIAALADIARPTVGIVTTVGETHIELLGSVENIACAKAELVQAIERSGTVFLNMDNPYVKAMRRQTQAKTVYYGLGQDADVWGDSIRHGASGTTFDYHWQGERISVFVPAYGRHNVYNTLAAIAVGLDFGLTYEEIQTGLHSFVPSAMRLHVEKIGKYTVINDAYNASPLSMSAAIDTLRDIATGRMVAVLGDMLELGHVAKEAHRQVGRILAQKGVELVVTVGEQAKHIAAAVCESGFTAYAFDQHETAKEELIKQMRPGDTFLVKGSRGMQMEKMLDVFKDNRAE